jgi:type VI secretion system secreted protein Hcp
MRHVLRRAAATAIALTAVLGAASPASAAPDGGVGTLTLKTNAGDVIGESPILSFSWGISNPITVGGSGGGAGAGKANLTDFSLMKRINPLSTDLFQAAATGTHFQKAVVSVPIGGVMSPFAVEYELSQVFVTSVQQSGGGSGTSESVSLAFGALKQEIGNAKFGWSNDG